MFHRLVQRGLLQGRQVTEERRVECGTEKTVEPAFPVPALAQYTLRDDFAFA